MMRTASLALAALAGIGLLTTGCGASDEDYCAVLPGYFRAREQAQSGTGYDSVRAGRWLRAAEEAADLAPDDMAKHWVAAIDHVRRIITFRGDGSKIFAGVDPRRAGAAGEIFDDAQDRCGFDPADLSPQF